MSLRITHNVEAFNAYRNLNATSSQISKSMCSSRHAACT